MTKQERSKVMYQSGFIQTGGGTGCSPKSWPKIITKDGKDYSEKTLVI